MYLISLAYRWNSALITTQPQNEYFWSVVTPSFLNGFPFDMTAANNTLIARSGLTVEGLYHGFGQPSLNYLAVPDGSGVLPGYGDFLNDTAYVRWLTSLQNEMTALPEIAIEGTLGYEKLSTLDCLTRYLTYSRDASNLLLVSSTDIADPANDIHNSNNSLLVFGYYGSPWQSIQVGHSPWECGHSNDFICVRPETWVGNSTLVANWNVYGYKIDYCLSKTTSLENKCSVRFVLPILIGMFLLAAVQCHSLTIIAKLFALPISASASASAILHGYSETARTLRSLR